MGQKMQKKYCDNLSNGYRPYYVLQCGQQGLIDFEVAFRKYVYELTGQEWTKEYETELKKKLNNENNRST